MAEARKRRAELRRQKILAQGGRRLAVVKGEEEANPSVKAAEAAGVKVVAEGGKEEEQKEEVKAEDKKAGVDYSKWDKIADEELEKDDEPDEPDKQNKKPAEQKDQPPKQQPPKPQQIPLPPDGLPEEKISELRERGVPEEKIQMIDMQLKQRRAQIIAHYRAAAAAQARQRAGNVVTTPQGGAPVNTGQLTREDIESVTKQQLMGGLQGGIPDLKVPNYTGPPIWKPDYEDNAARAARERRRVKMGLPPQETVSLVDRVTGFGKGLYALFQLASSSQGPGAAEEEDDGTGGLLSQLMGGGARKKQRGAPDYLRLLAIILVAVTMGILVGNDLPKDFALNPGGPIKLDGKDTRANLEAFLHTSGVKPEAPVAEAPPVIPPETADVPSAAANQDPAGPQPANENVEEDAGAQKKEEACPGDTCPEDAIDEEDLESPEVEASNAGQPGVQAAPVGTGEQPVEQEVLEEFGLGDGTASEPVTSGQSSLLQAVGFVFSYIPLVPQDVLALLVVLALVDTLFSRVLLLIFKDGFESSGGAGGIIGQMMGIYHGAKSLYNNSCLFIACFCVSSAIAAHIKQK